MRKRGFELLLCLMLSACCCIAQKSNLQSYYYWINQAELAICDSNYQKASACFFCIDSLGFILLPKNVKKIDKERNRILLSETWEDYAKKICYRYCNDTEFNIAPLTFVYQGDSEETDKLINDIKKENVKGSYYILPNSVR